MRAIGSCPVFDEVTCTRVYQIWADDNMWNSAVAFVQVIIRFGVQLGIKLHL